MALVLLVALLGASAFAAGNIDDTGKYAWSTAAGWVNFNPVYGGVTVHDSHLSGHAWSENVGWIKLGADAGGPYANTAADNWGVNNDNDGQLSGFGWSTAAGWVNFDPAGDQQVVIDDQGRFSGLAWSENLGWISFASSDPVAYGVVTDWRPQDLPAVTTAAASGIGVDAATGHGEIVRLGVPDPTEHGFCWGTSANPTVDDDSTTTLGAPAGTGVFSAPITGLASGTIYHVRAFATNAVGTAYGEDVTFATGVTVAFQTDGTEGATLTGELLQTLTYGADTSPILAVPPAGHDFVAWSGGYVGTENPLTLTNVTASLVVTANFQLDQVACGSTFAVAADEIEGLDRFRRKPKVYATYEHPVSAKPGKASAKVLTKPDKEEGEVAIACEWTKKLRLYDLKAFRASEAGGVGAAGWITGTTMADLIMDLRLVSKEAADQSVRPLALAVPVIERIEEGGKDAKGNDTLILWGQWFGTGKPRVWREYWVPGKVDGAVVVKRQAMKVLKPTEADADDGFRDRKGKPAYMNAEEGTSKAVVIVPAKAPRGLVNGTVVLDNGVGLAAGGIPVGDAP
jgi:hypothetical protein